ncbi:MAG: AmmeMemoRadiSam system protein B [Candidatus Aenigmarchaeota archaeon]|nr:AmmeMemoRadiSam system protein B [Candidatus Aenigmarchaeota archaeon]
MNSKIYLAVVVVAFFAVGAVLGYGSFTGMVVKTESIEVKTVIKPAVSGSFYPDDPGQLGSMIDGFLAEASPAEAKPRAIVVPHAGYIYSGSTAAHGFKALQGHDYETVIVIGSSHHYAFDGVAVPNSTHYRTPLGDVAISGRAAELVDGFIFRSNDVFEPEHSIEVEIPFLQSVLGDFEIIPILVSRVDPQTLASKLLPLIDENTLVVASSDLSHYYPYEEAVSLDSNCIEGIPALDFERFESCECCGRIPVLTVMLIAEEHGWVGGLLDYRNSGDTAGTKEAVVGYASIAFYETSEMLTKLEQSFLLSLARKTIEGYLTNQLLPEIDETNLSEILKETRGCFVTLNTNRGLRGCIGHILPQVPLYQCVIQNAVSAALHDARFTPVTSNELDGIHIDISVLSVPKKIEFQSPGEIPGKLRPGIDGVVLHYNGRTSTYLPQVWGQLPEKEEFLSSLCIKQGSPANCWALPGVAVETYQAFVFEEG